jgi:hypothetical protein
MVGPVTLAKKPRQYVQVERVLSMPWFLKCGAA